MFRMYRKWKVNIPLICIVLFLFDSCVLKVCINICIHCISYDVDILIILAYNLIMFRTLMDKKRGKDWDLLNHSNQKLECNCRYFQYFN